MELVLCNAPSAPEFDAQGASGLAAPYITIGDKALATADAALDRLGPSLNTEERRLFLVVQEGRLFQRAHPEVRILLDRGRHLVAEMNPELASALGDLQTPNFAVRSIEPGMTVVSAAPRVATEDRDRARARASDWVQALVDRVDQAPFEETLTRLTEFSTRLSTSPQYLEASAFVRDEFVAMGYDTRFEAVNFNGATTRNVIAEKVGRGSGGAPRDLIYVVAHLDSVNHDGGPNAPAPGADDNASGSAGVLSIARALRDHAAIHDLRLVLFGGEEQGLFGSLRHVFNLSAEERGRIKAVINMDMIGNRNTPTNAVLIEGAALSQNLIDSLASAAAAYTSLAVETSLFPFNSDHVPFIEAGLPAVLTIEGADGANNAVHGPNDVLSAIEVDLALEILRMNVAAVALALGSNE